MESLESPHYLFEPISALLLIESPVIVDPLSECAAFAVLHGDVLHVVLLNGAMYFYDVRSLVVHSHHMLQLPHSKLHFVAGLLLHCNLQFKSILILYSPKEYLSKHALPELLYQSQSWFLQILNCRASKLFLRLSLRRDHKNFGFGLTGGFFPFSGSLFH